MPCSVYRPHFSEKINIGIGETQGCKARGPEFLGMMRTVTTSWSFKTYPTVDTKYTIHQAKPISFIRSFVKIHLVTIASSIAGNYAPSRHIDWVYPGYVRDFIHLYILQYIETIWNILKPLSIYRMSRIPLAMCDDTGGPTLFFTISQPSMAEISATRKRRIRSISSSNEKERHGMGWVFFGDRCPKHP